MFICRLIRLRIVTDDLKKKKKLKRICTIYDNTGSTVDF